jgi:hypothetical protein
MRLWLLVFFVAGVARGAAPAELAEALQHFRSDPPPGWSYTLTTAGEGKSMVERCDAAKPEFDRWSLVSKDGRPPTPDESQDYFEGRSRRSRGGTAPKLAEQLDLDSVQTLGVTAEQATFACGLRRGDAADTVSPHLRATLVVHRPTHCILSIELASTGEFSPSLVMTIATMTTLMTYSLPDEHRPSLPQKVETHVRGRAFWFKSIDGDLTMTFSDYENVRAK